MRRWLTWGWLLLVGCQPCGPALDKHPLAVGPNPFGPADPLFSAQPRRDRPSALALSADGRTLYVALQGTEDEPGQEVAVVDLERRSVRRRLGVGPAPAGLALHPGGRFLVVVSRYANWATVIDTRTDAVVAELPVPWYTVQVAFSPDGTRAFLANRWKDSVLRWDLRVDDRFEVVGDDHSHLPADAAMGVQVASNPRELAVSADGQRLYVASATGVSVSVLDVEPWRERRRVFLNAAAGGVAAADGWVFVSHTGQGTGHPADDGPDTDRDGQPGDKTANVMFQDLQNELAVFDADLELRHPYTSDTLCCLDFRDVDPDRPERGRRLAPPDTWEPSRVAHLPPRSSWVVAGALPEKVVARDGTLYVVFSGSNEVQSFSIAADGALTPRQRAGGLFPTGMNPADLVLSPDGRRGYVADRLGETVTVLDLEQGPGHEDRIALNQGPPFPSTDAELGEAVNFVTAPFTVDGDQTCAHCHRDGSNLGKLTAMPLQVDFTWGARAIMAYRGAADTRPWFFESAMTEVNFFPVLNELARKENFCCEQLDAQVWRRYPSAEACVKMPGLAGCAHVLDCRASPPPECSQRPYGSPQLTRNAAMLSAARRLFGRDRTFGDALYREVTGPDGSSLREGIPLDFNGVTRALGLFLLQRPRFLPNPNAALDTASVRRGRALYEDPRTGCALCHPLPLTTLATGSVAAGEALRFAAVVTPRRNPRGEDVDRITPGFLQSFPTAEQDAAGVRFGVPQLRGLWDRAELFLHDGRAPSLPEALATPGHPALSPGQRGFNETDGMPNTHGATGHLTPGELEDLAAYLRSL